MRAEQSQVSDTVEARGAPGATASGFGAPLARREDARLLAGRGRFVADLAADGCLSMVFVRSPVSRASIAGLRLSEARAAPGVVGLYAGDTVASLTGPSMNPVLEAIDAPAMPILAQSDVRAVGQPVVAIVAESEAEALDSADKVEIDLEPLQPVCDPEAALAATALIAGMDGNTVVDNTWRAGDTESAFAGAAVTAEVTIRHPRIAPMPLECRATMAEWDEDSQRLTIWSSTQTPHRARSDLARALGLAWEQVRAVAPDVGGAFGMKASIFPEDILVAFAARELGRPVRWIASRHEDLVSASHGRGAVTRGRMAFDADGRILALTADLVFPLGAWATFSAVVPAWNASRILPGPYAVDHVDARVRAVVTNTAAVGIYRGAGRPEAAMLLERLIETGARSARSRPGYRAAAQPRFGTRRSPSTRPNGTVLDSGDYRGLAGEDADTGRLQSRLRDRLNRRRDQGRDSRPGGGASTSSPAVGDGRARRSRSNREDAFTAVHRFQHAGPGTRDRIRPDRGPGARGLAREGEHRSRRHGRRCPMASAPLPAAVSRSAGVPCSRLRRHCWRRRARLQPVC